MIADSVMLDHPSWMSYDQRNGYRAIRSGNAVWALTWTTDTAGNRVTTADRVQGRGGHPIVDLVDPLLLSGPATMVHRLGEIGTVARWRNPDLWDALATSIVRQVIRAGQARTLYRSFCQEHGEPVQTPLGTTWLFPTAAVVLDLPDTEFTRVGMTFKRRPLRAAAAAYVEYGAKWADLDPAALVLEVQAVPRIGPWTAGATVADLTNDYSLYPYADLAVRTWAKRLDPERAWPDTESDFAHAWTRLAGNQLSDWTLLTLAWGVHHAHTTGAVAF